MRLVDLCLVVAAPSGQDPIDLVQGGTVAVEPRSLRPRPGVGNGRDAVSVEGAAKPSRAMGGRDSAGVDRRPVYLTTQKQTSNRVTCLVNGQVENLEFVGSHLAREVRSGD